jgi:DNA polymerase-1
MHIPIIEVAGYEADDLIGTIAKQAEKQNQVFMVTQIRILLNWYPKIYSCINPLVGNGIEIWGIPEGAKFEIERTSN